jgi:hypothetical protein
MLYRTRIDAHPRVLLHVDLVFGLFVIDFVLGILGVLNKTKCKIKLQHWIANTHHLAW